MNARRLKLAAVITLAALAPALMAPSGSPPPVPSIVICSGGPCNVANIKVGQQYIVYKVNNTSISNSTTQTADPDLQYSNVPNGQYALDAYFSVDLVTTTTQGFAWTLLGSSGVAVVAQGSCLYPTGAYPATTVAFNFFGDNGGVASSTTALPANQGIWFQCHTHVSMSATNTIIFRWAQAVANANATLVQGTNNSEGSRLILTRLQ